MKHELITKYSDAEEGPVSRFFRMLQTGRSPIRKRSNTDQIGVNGKMNIYVGNLSRDAVDDDVKKLFERYGRVVSVRIIRDKETGISKGYSFVEMPIRTEAELAIAELRGREFMGRTLRIDEGHGINSGRQHNTAAMRYGANGNRQHRSSGSSFGRGVKQRQGEENWRYRYLS
jgi:RNA recognition motif-containing protein